MRVDLFDFDLPPELIAQAPVQPRDAARLLLVDGGPWREAVVRELPGLLRPGDLLVLNDTRVLPTRFFGRRGAVPVEVTLVERIDAAGWWALARPGKRLRPGDAVELAPGLVGRGRGQGRGGQGAARASSSRGEALLAAIRAHGAMPLPPYIRRERGGDPRDRDDYQTVFARRDGAVAAPTAVAAPHRARCSAGSTPRGIERCCVTLHVGAGTFAPVKVDGHRASTACTPNGARCPRPRPPRSPPTRAARRPRRRRRHHRAAHAGECGRTPTAWSARVRGETRLFITPGYRFRVVDLLLTNFHLPRSTLFMLVAAFAGLERMQAAYAHAVAERFRFFSYGDACLLDPRGAAP